MYNTSKPHLASLTLEPSELGEAYLSFLDGGGVFIPNLEQDYRLGEEIFLKVDLAGATEPYRLVGKVAWISAHTDGKQFPKGVGLQFQDAEGSRLHQEIKVILAVINNKDN